MSINAEIKDAWIQIQKKSEVPVNAIGLRISPSDAMTLRVWREEGIDQFLRK